MPQCSRLVLIAVLMTWCVAFDAHAQDDDLLTPLTPMPAKKAVKKRKPRAKPPPQAKKPEADLIEPLVAPAPRKAELWVRTQANLKGAKLYLDDKELATLPAPVQEIPAGEHRVVIKRLGYADFVRKIQAPPGKLTELVAQLEPIAAVLTVSSDVPDAEVLVDGVRVGTTPLAPTTVSAGTHVVTVKKTGFPDDVRTMSMRIGRDYSLTVRLKDAKPPAVAALSDRPVDRSLVPSATSGLETPSGLVSKKPAASEPPLYKRWYFWAGTAAIVTVVTIAIVRPFPGGRFSDTEICANAPPGSCGSFN